MNYVFFTDRDLGKRFPETLASNGLHVEPHHVHFSHDTPDVEWLAVVGDREWYALTHNKRIRYTPNEIEKVLAHNVGLFVLVGSAPFSELAENFVRTIDRVISFIERHDRPFIAKVYRPTRPSHPNAKPPQGRVELWK